jgi:hypothetical protein
MVEFTSHEKTIIADALDYRANDIEENDEYTEAEKERKIAFIQKIIKKLW